MIKIKVGDLVEAQETFSESCMFEKSIGYVMTVPTLNFGIWIFCVDTSNKKRKSSWKYFFRDEILRVIERA